MPFVFWVFYIQSIYAIGFTWRSLPKDIAGEISKVSIDSRKERRYSDVQIPIQIVLCIDKSPNPSQTHIYIYVLWLCIDSPSPLPWYVYSVYILFKHSFFLYPDEIRAQSPSQDLQILRTLGTSHPQRLLLSGGMAIWAAVWPLANGERCWFWSDSPKQ